MIDDFLNTLLGTWPSVKYLAIGVAVFGVAEYFFPAESGQPWRDRLESAWYSLVYCVMVPFVVYLPAHYLSQPILSAFGNPIITIDLDKLVGDGEMGWLMRNLALPFAPLFVFDFFYYWTHRLQHRLPFLWGQHKLHHLEYSLNAATSLRHHWLEDVVRIFSIAIPMGILIKVTGGSGSFLITVIGYWGFLIHANIRLPFGPLTKVFAGPQLHRIHHSASPEHFDKNFAAFFPIWDIIFGSYCHPKKGEWPATGMLDGERTGGFLRGLWLPFIPLLALLKPASTRQPN